MYKRRILFFQLLVFILISCASSKVSSGNKIFLWKVQSDKNTVYLLGSIHLANESLYPLDNRIEKAFDSSGVLVVELNINNVNPGDLIKKAEYTDSNTLEQNVSKETYDIIKNIFLKHKVPEILYRKFKPWFAAIMAMNLELEGKGFEEKYGIDKHFLDLAKNKKKIMELESFNEQLNLLEELDKNPNDFINYSMEDLNNSTEQLEEMISAWKTGDTKTFENLINEPVEKNPSYGAIMDIFIKKRNIKMVEKIKGYLETNENYFVVVGAGHLIGNDGIVNLLKQTGKYKIEQY